VSYRTCVQGLTSEEIDIAASEADVVYEEWEEWEAGVAGEDDEDGGNGGKGAGRIPRQPAEPPPHDKGKGYGKNGKDGKDGKDNFEAYIQGVIHTATVNAHSIAHAGAAAGHVVAIPPLGRVPQAASGLRDMIPIRRDTLRDITESLDDAVRATEQARRILESGSVAFEEQQRRLKSSLISLRRALEVGSQI
jgi:hypothetical protein